MKNKIIYSLFFTLIFLTFKSWASLTKEEFDVIESEISTLHINGYDDIYEKSENIVDTHKFNLKEYFKIFIKKFKLNIYNNEEWDDKNIETTFNNNLRVFLNYQKKMNNDLYDLFYQEKSSRNIFSIQKIHELMCNEYISHPCFFTTSETLPIIFLDFIRQHNNISGTNTCLVAVRHLINPHQPHLSPVIFHYGKDKKIHVIILDTLGMPYKENDPNNRFTATYKNINLHFSEQIADSILNHTPLEVKDDIVFYTTDFPRQADMYSCPLFTKLDLEYLSRVNMDDFISEYTGECNLFSKDDLIIKNNAKFILFNKLPEELMRGQQIINYSDRSNGKKTVFNSIDSITKKPTNTFYRKIFFSHSLEMIEKNCSF